MAASNSGLTARDEKALRDALQKADALGAGRAYLGGRERQEFDALVSDLKRRLDPETPERLAARFDAMVTPLLEFDWAKRALGALEEADAA
jgi:hypothetical protein